MLYIVLRHAKSHNLISSSQWGFLSRRSTGSQECMSCLSESILFAFSFLAIARQDSQADQSNG